MVAADTSYLEAGLPNLSTLLLWIFEITKLKSLRPVILDIEMKRARPYSPYALEAAQLLGEQIRNARRGRRWSQNELAERAGITPGTLIKIERGEPSVRLGTAFEAASLVGVPLFHADRSQLTLDLDRTRARSALLPERIRPRREDVQDEF
jgi:transcriptional regulator with XRE-family HTH domain